MSIENEYYLDIKEFQTVIVNKTFEKLDSRLAKWIKKDSESDDFERFKQELEDELIALFGATFLWNSKIANVINSIAQKVFTFNNAQWGKQTEKVIGLPWKVNAEWWIEMEKEWAFNNYTLIRNLSQEYINKLDVLIVTAIQSYWNYSSLQESIRKLADKVVGYRSALIARDQVGNLCAAIWMTQYKEIGLDYYIWETALDEKVRGNPMGKYPRAVPSHWVMQGLLMSWSNMGVYSDDLGKSWKAKKGIMERLHVAMAIACRCRPRPFWNDKIAKIDREIG